MKKLFLLMPAAVFAFGLSMGLGPMPVQTAQAEEMGDVVRGGKLYDRWYAVTRAKKPKKTHAAWPASNTKKKGATTHRCKSCHGWDYMGKDGAYASGSYKTGIPGINGKAGADPASIVAILKDKNHDYGDYLDPADLNQLAMFVSKGQVDMTTFIDKATKKPKGDAAKGGAYYHTICAQCHGKKGELPKDMKKTLGKQMAGNPWEVLHKILNGQPRERMPALHALDHQIAGDIMAYLATLPTDR